MTTILRLAPKLLALALLASGTALAGACSHPYIPQPGTYTYQTEGTGPGSTVISTVKFDGKNMLISSVVNGNASDVTFNCQTGAVVVNAAGKSMNINTSSLPEAKQWKVGYSWKTTTKNNGMLTNSDNRIVATERMSTPAGSFDAFKIETITSMSIEQMLKDQGMSPDMIKEMTDRMSKSLKDVKTTAWYVQGRGLVKQVSEKFTMQLTSVKP